MPNTQSGINDEELNQMIASLQHGQNNGAPAGQKVIQPPTQPSQPAGNPINDVNPVSNVFNQQPAPANLDGKQPINLSALGDKAEPINVNSADTKADANINITDNNTASQPDQPALSSDLESIKRQAITELRPLVDKLDLPPEDKFDTLLLLIRTTDDSSLIPAAHDAAKAIADDTRRAQALLDVIKEIDFFGQKS